MAARPEKRGSIQASTGSSRREPGVARLNLEVGHVHLIEAQPYGELANKAKELRGSIAARDLRADQPDGLRHDAVSYCLQALQLFEGMDQQRFIAVLSEVAAVGQGGLQINEPGTSRSLKNLPGSWSDLALACLIHVGMKRLTPDQDSGWGLRWSTRRRCGCRGHDWLIPRNDARSA
ncbi:hypothetical protein NZK27_02240 [Synechococcus sp. FGCU-3]|nr:hypothetical protein [Synechococcus sp. FGCU3]